jgi:hypothetical protein
MTQVTRELIELAERVEKAEADRELDLAVDCAIRPGEWAPTVHKSLNPGCPLAYFDSEELPLYTSSIDAAMSLASDPLLKQFGGPSAMLREAMDRLGKQFALHARAWPDNQTYAQWLARFVTAAALRARSAATL